MQLHQPSFHKFHDHGFLKTVIVDYGPLMKLDHDKVSFSDYTRLQRYQYFVCSSFGQIMNQCDRIDQSKVLMNSYPNIQAWRNKYSQAEYLQYHTEMYLSAVAGLIDRLLLL